MHIPAHLWYDVLLHCCLVTYTIQLSVLPKHILKLPLLLLLDIRHKPTNEDLQMINYLYHYALPFTLVATKADKLGKSKIKPELKTLANYLKVVENNVVGVSSVNRYGKEAILDRIEGIINLFNQGEYVDEEE